MSHLYTFVLVAHVIIGVLGLGSIAAVALIATAARKNSRALADVFAWLALLLRFSVFILAAMLVTGILLDLAADGAFRTKWWFRGSALLLIATGALNARTRRAVRLGMDLRLVPALAYGMCVLIAAITVLMEVKPF
jgi:hypothetical protein